MVSHDEKTYKLTTTTRCELVGQLLSTRDTIVPWSMNSGLLSSAMEMNQWTCAAKASYRNNMTKTMQSPLQGSSKAEGADERLAIIVMFGNAG